MTILPLLPQKWSKRLIDLNVENLTEKDLSWADTAFIGGMAVQRKSAEQTIDGCKAHNLKIVAGGPLFTAEPKLFDEVDFLALDEADSSWYPGKRTVPVLALDALDTGFQTKIDTCCNNLVHIRISLSTNWQALFLLASDFIPAGLFS